MAKFGDIAGGLAQGIQTGFGIRAQQQQFGLQEQQLQIQQKKAQDEADDRELNRLVTTFGLIPKTDVASRQSILNRISDASDGVIPRVTIEQGETVINILKPSLDEFRKGLIDKNEIVERVNLLALERPEEAKGLETLAKGLEERGTQRELVQAQAIAGLQEDFPDIAQEAGAERARQQLITQATGKIINPRTGATIGDKPFAPQVERINIPTGDGKFQTMILDRTTGETTPATVDGKPIVLTEKELLLSEGKKAQSIINPFETKFLSELGKGEGERITALREKADTAVSSKRIIAEGRRLVADGIYTGSAANVKVALNKWLREAGIEVGGRTTSNTEAYAGAMGLQVGKIIQQFGAGTGLSDADREFAERIAAAKVTLTEDAIVKLLDINDRLATFTIEEFNRQAADAKQRIAEKDPFRAIEVPVFEAPVGVEGEETIEDIDRRIRELEEKQKG